MLLAATVIFALGDNTQAPSVTDSAVSRQLLRFGLHSAGRTVTVNPLLSGPIGK
jgi:hypothetical protein